MKPRCLRIHVVEEVEEVSDNNAEEIWPKRLAHDARESEEHPRQVRGVKVEDPEKVERLIARLACPHIDDHERERRAQKREPDKRPHAEHGRSPENQHPEHAACSPSKL
eukprot:Amastigsp_a339990_138.p2 type:complete len:109 gc:universal Amastigsp_a339990_138:613-287(-)